MKKQIFFGVIASLLEPGMASAARNVQKKHTAATEQLRGIEAVGCSLPLLPRTPAKRKLQPNRHSTSQAKRLRQASEDTFMASWIPRLRLQPASQATPSAEQRLTALRLRVAARASS